MACDFLLQKGKRICHVTSESWLALSLRSTPSFGGEAWSQTVPTFCGFAQNVSTSSMTPLPIARPSVPKTLMFALFARLRPNLCREGRAVSPEPPVPLGGVLCLPRHAAQLPR